MLEAIKRLLRQNRLTYDLLMPAYSAVHNRIKSARMRRDFGSGLVRDLQAGADRLAAGLAGDTPFLAGTIGVLELRGCEGAARADWPAALRRQLFVNVGVFPVDDAGLRAFAARYEDAVAELDLVGVIGNPGEARFLNHLAPDSTRVDTLAYDYLLVPRPWPYALAGRKVLIIHPFTESIAHQHARMAAVWERRPDLVPEFDIELVRMPLSPGLAQPKEASWSDRLNRLVDTIASKAFDIALIGAGGMSLPLGAAIKRMGKPAFHSGGRTQILFGIRGRRWDMLPQWQPIFTDAWVRPSAAETPPASREVEQGCYW